MISLIYYSIVLVLAIKEDYLRSLNFQDIELILIFTYSLSINIYHIFEY